MYLMSSTTFLLRYLANVIVIFFENIFWLVDFSVTKTLVIRVRPGRNWILLKPTYSLTAAPPPLRQCIVTT